MVKVLDRESINRMTRNSGRGGSTYVGGGGGGYTLPLAADGTRGGVQIGFTTDATARKYAVQLDGEKAYVNVPWTDHYAWSDISGKPNFATVATSGSYSDLSNKPSIPSVSGSVSGSTMTITINGTAYSLTDTNTWRPLGTGATDAAAGNHLHDDRYLKLSGGTMTGQLSINKVGYALKWNNDNYSVGSNNSPNDFYIWSEDSTARFRLGTNNLERLTVLANGNIGIGTQSPSYKLHVAGKIYCTGGFAFLSDIRKKNVVGFCNGFSVKDIANAPLIQYTLKGDLDDGRRHIGSVAQYWQKVLPDTVNEADDTLSMDQESILMASVITLARKVMSLENQIIQLKVKGYGKQ